MFVKMQNHLITILLVYVDDILLSGNNLDGISIVKSFLDQKFRIKDLVSLKFFLGLEVARSKSGIVLSQRKYAMDLLDDSSLLGCKPATVPMIPNSKFETSVTSLLPDPTCYRRLIGRLIYLSNTRPDPRFVVHKLSHYLASLHQSHYDISFDIFRYIKGCTSNIFVVHKLSQYLASLFNEYKY